MPGLNLAWPLQYKRKLMAHPTVMKQVLQGLNLAGPLQYKTILTLHPTVNKTRFTRA